MNLNLAYVRNMLLKNRFEQEEQEILEAVHGFSLENNSPFYGLIDRCIKNCLRDLSVGDFKSAAQEIQFIHNIPLSVQEISGWDECHFYSIEIPSYFDLTEKYDRIKSYIFEIAVSQGKIIDSRVLPKKMVN